MAGWKHSSKSKEEIRDANGHLGGCSGLVIDLSSQASLRQTREIPGVGDYC